MKQKPDDIIGRNIRPGFVPGGFTERMPYGKGTSRDYFAGAREVKEKAMAFLEGRGIGVPAQQNEARFAGRQHSPR